MRPALRGLSLVLLLSTLTGFWAVRRTVPGSGRQGGLVVPECHHRIGLGRTVSRNIVGRARYRGEQHGDGDERCRIGGFDLVESAGENSRGGKRSGSA